MPDWVDLLQWPAMLVTVGGVWLMASRHAGKRMAGFWLALVSNLLWIVWGWSDAAYALIVLQLSLLALNIRGVVKNHDG